MPMESTNEYQIDHDEISLKELAETLWRGRWLIVSAVLLSVGITATAIWLMPDKYRAVVVVAPVSDTSGGNLAGRLGSLASQFGGLASIAGLSLSGDSKKWEALAVLQSEALTNRYIQTNDLLPVLYASQWDRERNDWKTNDAKSKPTLWKANKYFKERIRKVSSDNKTGLVTLTITWSDPVLAAKWANDLVRMANDNLRDRAIAESERNISYLNEQASKTDVVGIRQTIYNIMETEINKAMLAKGSEEYAFKIIDPAVVPEKPYSPRPRLWTFASLLGTLLLSVAVAFVRIAWKKN
jgi:uncharacterized protein involved in exopolysaccharide biosynthesis